MGEVDQREIGDDSPGEYHGGRDMLADPEEKVGIGKVQTECFVEAPDGMKGVGANGEAPPRKDLDRWREMALAPTLNAREASLFAE